MSLILGIVIGIFLLFAYLGWRKGIIKTAVSLVSIILSMVICLIFTPILSKYIKDNTDVYQTIEKSVYGIMIKSDAFEDAMDESARSEAAITDEEVQEEIDGEGEVGAFAKSVAEKMGLPESIVSNIDKLDVDSKIDNIIDTGVISVKTVVAAMLAASVAAMILNAIIYVIVFLVSWVILKIIIGVTNIISRLPVIYQINKVAGLCLGVVEALIVVWLMFAIITASGASEWATAMLIDIGNNDFLNFLYNNNLVIKSLSIGL